MKSSAVIGRVAAALALTCAVMSQAQAAVVTVFGERFNTSIIDNFYDSLPGHSSTLVAPGTQLDTVNLTGVNLLWAVQPADSYTTAELGSMASFLSGGGRIAFMGEHGTYAPDENARINAALSFLGATISIIPGLLVDSGFRSASVGDGQILAHPLTTGVNTYQYAAFDPLTISGSAVALMRGEDNPADIMMAYQNIGPGSVFLITDQNVWDGSPNWPGGFNNGRMFENLLVGVTGAPPVCGQPGQPPCAVSEPASLALMAFGLLALPLVRRKRHV